MIAPDIHQRDSEVLSYSTMFIVESNKSPVKRFNWSTQLLWTVCTYDIQ